MNIHEFSDGFDTLVDSYRRFKDFDKREMLDSIEFDEYQKSLWLTLAEKEIVIGLYNGTYVGEAFEMTEELRRSLDALVKTKIYSSSEQTTGSTVTNRRLTSSSVFFTLPADIAFITLERVIFIDSSLGCYDGSEADVYPTTQDEYAKIRKNPFRGPTKYRVLRMDCGDGIVELISKYSINSYTVRYLANPEPIILEALDGELSIDGVQTAQTCKLNEILHRPILNRAVQMALASKGIQVN